MTVETVDTGKVWDMIKDIEFGMLTVRGSGGSLYSRPMTTKNGDADRGGVLCFFMSRAGQTVADIEAAADVNVAYANPGSNRYVSISGKAKVVDDRAKKEELWGATDKAWFPGGVDDPDLALVAVLVAEAEYWDVKSNKPVQLFKLAKAALTGAPPSDLAEHRRMRMR